LTSVGIHKPRGLPVRTAACIFFFLGLFMFRILPTPLYKSTLNTWLSQFFSKSV
jgi:hypothetical protein